MPNSKGVCGCVEAAGYFQLSFVPLICIQSAACPTNTVALASTDANVCVCSSNQLTNFNSGAISCGAVPPNKNIVLVTYIVNNQAISF